MSQVSTRGAPSGAPGLRGHLGHLGHLKENQGLSRAFRVDTCWTLVDTCSTPETRNPTGGRWGSHLHSAYRMPAVASTSAAAKRGIVGNVDHLQHGHLPMPSGKTVGHLLRREEFAADPIFGGP